MKNHLYMPVLKAKRGELDALKNLSLSVKEKVIPLLEIVPAENTTNEAAFLRRKANAIAAAVGKEHQVCIDARLYFSRSGQAGKKGLLRSFFEQLSNENVQFVPVLGLTRHKDYASVCSEFTANGLCFRLTEDELCYDDFAADFERELHEQDLDLNQIDVVLDLKSLALRSENLALQVAVRAINETLRNVADFRMVAITGSSFPVDLSNLEPGIHRLERKEWLLYKKLEQRLLKRMPIFGDYGIAHEDWREGENVFLTPSASIRYTSGDYWMILRGRSLRRFGNSQYAAFCNDLLSHPDYLGNDYSFGDSYIQMCAAGVTSNGSPEVWIRVGVNHHITVIVDLLAKRSDSSEFQ